MGFRMKLSCLRLRFRIWIRKLSEFWTPRNKSRKFQSRNLRLNWLRSKLWFDLWKRWLGSEGIWYLSCKKGLVVSKVSWLKRICKCNLNRIQWIFYRRSWMSLSEKRSRLRKIWGRRILHWACLKSWHSRKMLR